MSSNDAVPNTTEAAGLGADGTDENGVVKGYMCLVDWQHHVGADMSGNLVHWSEEDIRRDRPCVLSCGIIEIEIRAIRIVSPQNLDGEPEVSA